MEAALGGCGQDEDVFLWLISPHGAVPPGPHPTPVTDAAKGARRQTQRTVKVYIYHLLSCSWSFGSYRSYKREDTCPLMMLAAVEKGETGMVHHLCTTGRCGTKHPRIAALRFETDKYHMWEGAGEVSRF